MRPVLQSYHGALSIPLPRGIHTSPIICIGMWSKPKWNPFEGNHVTGVNSRGAAVTGFILEWTVALEPLTVATFPVGQTRWTWGTYKPNFPPGWLKQKGETHCCEEIRSLAFVSGSLTKRGPSWRLAAVRSGGSSETVTWESFKSVHRFALHSCCY